MKFGLTDSQYKYILETVVYPLQMSGAKVWCFGSRARGDHQAFSDLDLMVESNSDLSTMISKIKEKLEKENFPFKVDLVELNNFAENYKISFQKDKKPF